MIKIFKRLIGISAAIILIAFIIIKLAWSQPYKPEEVPDSRITFNKLTLDEGLLHYAYSGNENSNLGVIFIHGTPGGWAAFERYLVSTQLQKHFFMVSVDRPGWGGSTTDDKKLNGIFSHQASSIAAVFKEHPDKKWLVVGHSLGASLAPQIALESPEAVDGLLLLAGSLNPTLGSPRWYNYAAKTWLVSKMVGPVMTDSNREIMKLHRQLNIMTTEIEKTKLPANVIVIQGLKDKLVSPKNPQYVVKEWQDNFDSVEIIELPEAGHFLPWQEKGAVVQALHTLAQKNNSQ